MSDESQSLSSFCVTFGGSGFVFRSLSFGEVKLSSSSDSSSELKGEVLNKEMYQMKKSEE